MKQHILSFALLCSIIGCRLQAVDIKNPGAMNPDWFNTGGENGAYKQANQLQDEQKFEEAAQAYKEALQKKLGSDYDQNMAQLNLGSCQTAQGQAGKGWAAFDSIHNKTKNAEEQAHLAGKAFPANMNDLKGKTVVITEDGAGIGDDFHFFALLNLLQQNGCTVVLALSKGFLTPALQSAAQKEGVNIVKPGSDEYRKADLFTHLFALFGHLKANPSDLRPTQVVHTPPVRADGTDPLALVAEPVDAILNKDAGNEIIFLHIGEASRAAVVPGGRTLTQRHISPEAVNALLRKYKNLHIIDMGASSATTKFNAADDVKDRVTALPGDKAFDTILAAALIMRSRDRALLIKADNGPGNVAESNVGGKCDTKKSAADRTATIVFIEQHDWRMHGSKQISEIYKKFVVAYANGKKVEVERYRHLLAAGLVFRGSRANEVELIEQAYRDMSTVNPAPQA